MLSALARSLRDKTDLEESEILLLQVHVETFCRNTNSSTLLGVVGDLNETLLLLLSEEGNT